MSAFPYVALKVVTALKEIVYRISVFSTKLIVQEK